MKNSGANTVASEAMENRDRQNRFNQIEGQAGGSFGDSFRVEQAKDNLKNAQAKKAAGAFNQIEGQAKGPLAESFQLAQASDANRDRSPLVDTFASQAEEERKRIRNIAATRAVRKQIENGSEADERVA